MRTYGAVDLRSVAATPSVPVSDAIRLYAKASDGKLYTLNSAGVETVVGSGAGGGGTDEVWIGPSAPSDPNIELWFDSDATPAVFAQADAGIWQSYTPILKDGGSIGAGSSSGKYTRIGNTIIFEAYVKLGSGFVIATNMTISIPVTSKNLTTSTPLNRVTFVSSGSNSILGNGACWSTGVSFGYLVVSGTVAGWGGGISATAPFTWKVNDEIHVGGTYEAA